MNKVKNSREGAMSKQTIINAKQKASKAHDKFLLLKFVKNKTIKKLKNDDKLFSRFVEENAGFIHSIVARFGPKDSFDYEDYYQIGLLGLHKAVRKFNPKRPNNSTLSTFAYTVIYNDILQAVKKNNKTASREVSMENFTRKYDNETSSEYSETLFSDPSIDRLNNFENRIVNSIITRNYIKKLENIHQRIFNYRFVDGLKHKDIAKKLGLNIHTYKHIFYFSVYPKIKELKKTIQS